MSTYKHGNYKGDKQMSTYKEHYEECIKNYTKEDDKSEYTSAYDLTISQDIIEETPEYHSIINTLSERVKEKFDEYDGCFKDHHAIRLNDWRDIEEISELADLIMPQIERKVFKSNLKVETVHPYRNIAGQNNHKASWLWHNDDNPPEFLKLVVYLNEVTDKNGCFEFIVAPDGKIPKIQSSRVSPTRKIQQVFPGSRVPMDVVDGMLEEGYSIGQLTGGKGTYALLDPNVIHRATVPEKGTTPRDAIFFFLRPVLNKQESYISEDTYSYLPERNVKEYPLD